MTEFKILDNGIELYYSNFQVLNKDEFQIVVRAERWNSDMARYEGLDVTLPSERVDNIEYLKSNQIDEFKEAVLQNKKELIKVAKETFFIDEGDDLIDLSNYLQDDSTKNKGKTILSENISHKPEFTGEENSEEGDSFLGKLFKKFLT